MRRGQIFSTDLVVSLIIVVAFVGIVTAGFDVFLQNSAETVDSVKMHQLAADAAAIKHYEDHEGAIASELDTLKQSAFELGYSIDPLDNSAYQACIVVIRGSGDNEVSAEVCR